MKTPKTPDVPGYRPNSDWFIDMNYLMPFSVMLMILCVLLFILCYLRHRMRQRRRIQRQLQQFLRNPRDVRNLHLNDLECQFSACPDRLTMMYPPTYDEATFHSQQKEVNDSLGLPPSYSECISQVPTERDESPPHNTEPVFISN